jgi:hypothetical protein
MSSSDMEMHKSFQRPRKLFRGRIYFVAKKLAKSSTSCCLSAGSSRSLATTASSIECPAMFSSYLSAEEEIISHDAPAHPLIELTSFQCAMQRMKISAPQR